MLGLSFNTKSMFLYSRYLNVKILFTFIIYPYNIHIKQNVLHNFTAVRW